MRSLFVTTAALIAATAIGPAQGAQSYGAQYGTQYDQGAWQDVPPVPLNLPGRTTPPPARPTPSPGDWHDHADRMRDQSASDDHGGWQREGGARGQADWRGQEGWQGADRGDRGRRADRGWTMPHYWMSPAYAVSNWGFYGLGRPDRGQHWLRYYDAAVLVDERGTVIQSVDDLDWDRSVSGASGYAELGTASYGARYGGQAVGSNYAPSGYPQAGYASPVYAPPIVYGAAPLVTSYVGPGYATTTIVQAAPVVTTTTTTTYIDEVSTRNYVRAAPRRVVHRPRRITCCCLCR